MVLYDYQFAGTNRLVSRYPCLISSLLHLHEGQGSLSLFQGTRSSTSLLRTFYRLTTFRLIGLNHSSRQLVSIIASPIVRLLIVNKELITSVRRRGGHSRLFKVVGVTLSRFSPFFLLYHEGLNMTMTQRICRVRYFVGVVGVSHLYFSQLYTNSYRNLTIRRAVSRKKFPCV